MNPLAPDTPPSKSSCFRLIYMIHQNYRVKAANVWVPSTDQGVQIGSGDSPVESNM